MSKFNPNDFYKEIILNDEIMLCLESAPKEHHSNKLVLTFLTSYHEHRGNLAIKARWEPDAEFYLTKEEIFKLLDFLLEFKQISETEKKEERNE